MALYLTGNTSNITIDSTSGITFPNATLQTVAAQTGPAFSAYLSSNQSIAANTDVKVQFNAEEYDTNSNYDSTTNYRFTPTVAGYYQFNCGLYINTQTNYWQIRLYKNGALYKLPYYNSAGSAQVGAMMQGFSVMAYANGTTDYFEIYTNSLAANTLPGSGIPYNYFQGFLARVA